MRKLMEDNIYSAIFDITKDNIQAAGGSFSVSKEAFMELSGIHPKNADVLVLSRERNNRLFLEKAYIRMLKRLADERAVSMWEGRFSLPCEEFQRLLVMTLISSPEFKGKNVDVYNNIYSSHNTYHGVMSSAAKPVSVRQAERRIKIYNALRKVYNILPECIKKILRAVLKM